jgi:dienelactone hydrolase
VRRHQWRDEAVVVRSSNPDGLLAAAAGEAARFARLDVRKTPPVRDVGHLCVGGLDGDSELQQEAICARSIPVSGVDRARGVQWSRASVVVALSVAALALAACRPSPSASPSETPSITVTPTLTPSDEPFRIVVRHLSSRREASVQISSKDARGTEFEAASTFRANSTGVLELEADEAMSLVTAMDARHGRGLYLWGHDPQTFTVSVSQGTAHAQVAFRRQGLAAGVALREQTIAQDGFVGQYWQPAPSSPDRPAILLFGGSEGGLAGQLAAGRFASHGYPTLEVAYFGAAGLPSTLADIPLEYFATALRWLRVQDGVLDGRVVVVSASRGSEAALLLASNFPDLVSGVVASVPASVAVCSYPGCDRPAWTLGGRPVPFTHQFNEPHPTDDPAAVIPVETARARFLFACGGADAIWHSCDYADALEARLAASNYPQSHQVYAYPNAGHGLGVLVPFEPGIDDFDAASRSAGENPGANNAARADLWQHVLAFLAEAGK